MSIRLKALVEVLGGQLIGDGEILLSGIAPLDVADATHITFLSNPKLKSQAAASKAAALIVSENDNPAIGAEYAGARVVTANPYAYFARTAQMFAAQTEIAPPAGIHPSAVVDPGAMVDPTASIGPHVVIEAGAKIGEHAVVGAGCYIGRHAVLGAQTLFHPRVTFHADCRIGARGIIHSGAVIGADGFGFERSEHGVPERFPHVGTVVIEDDVEIGANACIDRGALGATVIRAHARIDDLVYVAHNVEVGEGALVVAMTMMAGGAKLGERCYIAPSSILRDGISIGGEAIVGLGAVVVGDVAPGATVAGNPARDIAELKALGAALRELAAGRRSVLPGD